jgi:hypothetical protein
MLHISVLDHPVIRSFLIILAHEYHRFYLLALFLYNFIPTNIVQIIQMYL